MRRALKLSAVVLLSALVTFVIVTAQSSVGTVRGVVRDSSGAVMPGVTITISRAGTKDRTGVTNEKGEFVFVGVEPGRYEITAALSGFATVRVSAVVSTGGVSNLQLELHIGSLAETVAVTGNTPGPDTSNDAPL